MVPLFDGIIDYERFFEELKQALTLKTSSLEWFGDSPDEQLKTDCRKVRDVLEKSQLQFM